jgi:hypothetical protein
VDGVLGVAHRHLRQALVLADQVGLGAALPFDCQGAEDVFRSMRLHPVPAESVDTMTVPPSLRPLLKAVRGVFDLFEELGRAP